jgi:hypothetical protein
MVSTAQATKPAAPQVSRPGVKSGLPRGSRSRSNSATLVMPASQARRNLPSTGKMDCGEIRRMNVKTIRAVNAPELSLPESATTLTGRALRFGISSSGCHHAVRVRGADGSTAGSTISSSERLAGAIRRTFRSVPILDRER